MKKTLTLLSCLMGILLFTGCKKKDTTTNDPTPTNYLLSAKVNGTLFHTDWAFYSWLTNPDDNYSITCNSTDANNVTTSFSIAFYGDTLGTYTFSDGSDPEATATYSNGIAPNIVTYTAVSGTIIVTKIDVAGEKISGTFNFTAKDSNGNTKTITEGKLVDVPEF